MENESLERNIGTTVDGAAKEMSPMKIQFHHRHTFIIQRKYCVIFIFSLL